MVIHLLLWLTILLHYRWFFVSCYFFITLLECPHFKSFYSLWQVPKLILLFILFVVVRSRRKTKKRFNEVVVEKKGKKTAAEKQKERLEREVKLQCPDTIEGLEEAKRIYGKFDLGWKKSENPQKFTLSTWNEYSLVVATTFLNKNHINISNSDPAFVKDKRGGMILKVFRNFLTEAETNQLENTTNTLTDNLKGKFDKKRGVPLVYHLGCWRKYTELPFVTVNTRNRHSQDWILKNRDIFLKLNDLFYQEFPVLLETYWTVENLPARMFGTWASVAINCHLDEDVGIGLHSDEHDFADGFCWTIPFGNFSEGDLNFPDLNTTVAYKTGDVAVFQSRQQHEVKKFRGKRFSLVLFSHNNLFYPCKSK